MNIYDLMQKYGSERSETYLWDAIYAISKYVEQMKDLDPALTEGLYKEVYQSMCGKHFNYDFGLKQVEAMSYIDKDTRHYAPYWAIEDMKASYELVKCRLPEQYTEWDFIVSVNYLKTQMPGFMEAYFGDAEYKTLVEMAVSFLNDPDEEHKIWSMLE